MSRAKRNIARTRQNVLHAKQNMSLARHVVIFNFRGKTNAIIKVQCSLNLRHDNLN
jgi:hypothetical protein